MPYDLAQHLREIGIAPPALPPRDPAHDRAVRTGISGQWAPTYPGEPPPF